MNLADTFIQSDLQCSQVFIAVDCILCLGCLRPWCHLALSIWNLRSLVSTASRFPDYFGLHYEHDDILTSFSQQLLESAQNLGEIPSSLTHKLEHHELAAVSRQHQAQTLLKVPQEALAKTWNPLGAVWTERATDAVLPSTTEQSTFLLRLLVLSTPSTR